MYSIKVLSENSLHCDDAFEYINDLKNIYKTSDGYIALDDEDFNYIISNSKYIETIEYELNGEIITEDDYSDILDRKQIKGAKNVLVFLTGTAKMVDVKSIVECIDALKTLVGNVNIIYGAGIEKRKIIR